MKTTSQILVRSLLFTIVVGSLIYGHQLLKKSDYKKIRIVGSSITFPFITLISENLSKKDTNIIIETTGTGAGFQLFCQKGNSHSHPEMVAASRPITEKEKILCKKNNVEPVELLFGYDAMLLLSSGTNFHNITREELFLALAEYIPSKDILIRNTLHYWNEINPSLPKTLIEIYGPPHSSGTRDEINKIVMEYSCRRSKLFNTYKKNNSCSSIRRDGRYIETGDNENLTIQKLKITSNALGILGYSFYIGNKDLNPVKIDSVYPDFYNISSFKYPLTRPLYLYCDKKKKETLKNFMIELTKSNFFTYNSDLTNIGLIPLNEKGTRKLHNQILSLIENEKVT